MKQNIKVAKELVKLAKNLLADHKYYDIDDDDSLSYLNDDYYEHEDYANRQVQQRHLYDERDDSNDEYSIDKNDNWLDDGKYINFTGQFSYGDKFRPFFADVQNATFELRNKKIFWENGTWSGTWKDGTWKDGTWTGGTWLGGTWENGDWQYGIWKDGIWKDGTWKDGTWTGGTWLGGTWNNGKWFDGTWKNGTWKDGNWYDGTWKDGTWIRGVWVGGKDFSGKKHRSNDSPDKWEK